ncbi:MAG: hypothetical protein HQL36_08310 [Alphaproteobacteria bacterium]|nr:hypothetical protein [Alphaproteobacteria bacterium]
MVEKSGHEKTLVMVKALPQVGETYGETVCCAGVTTEGKWRRQYPIRFRKLENKFTRWQWIEYDWRKPQNDPRRESRRVQEDTIKILGKASPKERTTLLNRIVVNSYQEAERQGDSLCLLRPRNTRFKWTKKPEDQLAQEKRAYQAATMQTSFLDTAEVAPFDPCPFEFKFEFEDDAGKHAPVCQDWETAAMFFNRRKSFTETESLRQMSETFNEEYPEKGMVFSMGTHSRFPIWMLIGIIRLDEMAQLDLGL